MVIGLRHGTYLFILWEMLQAHVDRSYHEFKSLQTKVLRLMKIGNVVKLKLEQQKHLFMAEMLRLQCSPNVYHVCKECSGVRMITFVS